MKPAGNTIYQVAQEAGVSITTVSRVLHGSNTVSAKTKARVEQVIERMNYKPSAIARGLTGQGTNTLGIILPRLSNPNYALIFTGACDEAQKHGMAVSLFPWKSLNSREYNPALMLAERRLDGIIINVEYASPEETAMLERELKELRAYMPVVLIGCVPSSLPYPAITYNHAACVQEIMRYLISLGHERIALVGGSEGDQDEFRRDIGYLAGLKEAQLPVMQNYRAYCKASAEEGAVAFGDMLDHLRPDFWPTAVIALNDMVALGCQQAARQRGLRIPEDLSLVGCDNLFFAPYNCPPLTTVDMKARELGAAAVRLLLSGETERKEGEWEIIYRESCGKEKSK